MAPDDMSRILEKRKKASPEDFPRSQSDIKVVTLSSCSCSTACVKTRFLEFMHLLFYFKQVAYYPWSKIEGYN